MKTYLVETTPRDSAPLRFLVECTFHRQRAIIHTKVVDKSEIPTIRLWKFKTENSSPVWAAPMGLPSAQCTTWAWFLARVRKDKHQCDGCVVTAACEKLWHELRSRGTNVLGPQFSSTTIPFSQSIPLCDAWSGCNYCSFLRGFAHCI